MRAIDICAGAGGLSLGLQRAGFEVLGVEHDADACEQHRRHVGPCEQADVTAWSPSASVELVAGGVPCQSWSTAGRRRGFDEARGHLFRHLVRIAVEANALAVLLENVTGLLSWMGGAALSEITRAFRAAGFERVAWTVLDAADFGVPQRRRRLFVVGFREAVSFSWPSPTHGPWLSASRPWVSVREAFGLDGDFATGRIPGATGWRGQRFVDVDRPATTTTCKNNADLLAKVAPTITANATDQTPDPQRPSRRPIANLAVILSGVSPTICAGGVGAGGGPEPIVNREQREALGDALAAAGLADRPGTSIQAHASGRLAKAGHHERQFAGSIRLSVEQCARLQDFPTEWDWSWMTKTSAHRCIGNAVPPALGEAVGGAVMSALVSAQKGAA